MNIWKIIKVVAITFVALVALFVLHTWKQLRHNTPEQFLKRNSAVYTSARYGFAIRYDPTLFNVDAKQNTLKSKDGIAQIAFTDMGKKETLRDAFNRLSMDYTGSDSGFTARDADDKGLLLTGSCAGRYFYIKGIPMADGSVQLMTATFDDTGWVNSISNRVKYTNEIEFMAASFHEAVVR